ncbi:hypothetical protein [Pseudonocardia spirodelae]|uniref:DUF2795 domain-containing protein n=1 Tax=Pseudonocardia spirodelae TaxID=3133431 RepID=A0ABU8T7G3_9PSEU
MTPTGHADTVPVTRVEVLDFVGELFGDGPVSRGELLAAARAEDARPLLYEVLDAALPDRPLTGLADLWRHVDVPEDLAAAR